jgi:hypothetical protein
MAAKSGTRASHSASIVFSLSRVVRVARHDVRSHAVPVALVGECSRPVVQKGRAPAALVAARSASDDLVRQGAFALLTERRARGSEQVKGKGEPVVA